MKKISVACVLIFLLTLSFPAYPAHAEESFPVSGKCGENVTWSLDEDGTMVISGSGHMQEYSIQALDSPYEYDMPWYVLNLNHKIKNIVIMDGVTNISSYAFLGSSVQTVKISGSVSEIGGCAFLSCHELRSIELPDNITRIYSGAFSYSSLEKVVLSESIDEIAYRLFDHCTSLKQIIIPQSVKVIDVQAFRGCSSLSSIYFMGDAPDFRNGVFDGVNATIYYYADNTTWTEEAIQEMRSETLGGENLTFQAMSRNTDNDDTSSEEDDDDMSENDENWTYDEEDETADLPGDEFLPNDTTDLPDESADGENEPSGSFADINPGDFYYDAVQWALENSITSGVDSDHFAPKEPCTRGQVVTFLWRAMGEPEPESAYNPFRDLSYDDYYYKAVLWAYQENITSGMTESAFGADAGCTRSQVVTFLWRANGRPDISYQGSFRDVPSGAYYASAVEWALANAVTSGTSLNTFSPDATCTRGQIVSFLYRSRS